MPTASLPRPIDLLIEPGWIIPVEPAGITLSDHAIAVDDGRIVAVVPVADARTRFIPRECRQLPEHVVVPGLINTHTHAAMTLLRGFADDVPLERWLREHIWPAEAKFAGPDFVYAGSRLACLEMLDGGVTCFNDMYFFPEATIQAATDVGIRACIGLVVVEFPTPYAADASDYLLKGLALRDSYANNSAIRFTFAPHAPYSVSDSSFERIATLADQLNLPIHVHLHETESEIGESLAQYGCRPLQRLDQLGVIGSHTIAVHGVHFQPDELEVLSRRGASVAHCPISNLKLGSGIANTAGMLARGINLCLGTDGAASNNRLDLWQEMRTAALLAKGSSQDAAVLNAHQALYAATLGGALAVGFDQEIGSIRPGKAADLCAVRLDRWQDQPCFDPASHLIYVTGREQVTDVWVDGKCRKFAGQLSDYAISELIAETKLWHTRLKAN